MNAEKKQKQGPIESKGLLFLRGGIVLSFLLVGLYYELSCAIISLYWIALLIWLGKQRKLSIRLNDALLATAGIFAFYCLSCFWAVDSGMALWGIVKYLPLPLSALCLMQFSVDDRKTVLNDLPWLGAAMTLITFGLQFIPLFSTALMVNGRLAGFFQYPNIFACFLLLGIEILFLGETEKLPLWAQIVCGVVLLFGLIQAGSRTIFVFAVPAMLVCLLIRRTSKVALMVTCSLGGGVLLSVPVGLLYGALSGAGRVAEISTGASTFLGRLLYWKDALPVVLEHPFGLGYLGYYFTQGSFQTGNYTVRWVHNDLLQLLLDVGWIPAILAMIAVIHAICSRKTGSLRRIVLVTLLAHCMMDFDLEFVSMYFILLLCLDWEDGRQCKFRFSAIPAALAVSLGIGSIYIGVVSGLTYSGNHNAAAALYPWNTLSNLQRLTMIENVDALEQLSDQILAQNDQVALAWDAKAQAAFSRGDFSTVIAAKRQAISLSPYTLEEYTSYFDLLVTGESLYLDAGDTESADYCRQEIASIQVILDEVVAQTDPLAWQLADPPELEMPQEYTQYLEETGLQAK